ncbi:glycosyl hydrolase family 65 protein [Clostridium sp. BL-8]|uniref:glycosyl hydrolase family 65 protein n=1 Tax=Clostridium sp. BL-8 TaxID=349938 RepID=UPI00098C96A1|nr:glycosyl hydrolase family 65 protein [Clostridium sp. BL-8]OOM78969.1 nigerose phosphorylase [Clostridium sp. BL-8]
MVNWLVEENQYNKDRICENGNKFLIGNGYLGIRGTLPEYEKEQFAAINLSGIYDQVGNSWREPLNAPNALFTYIEFDRQEYRLPNVEPLDNRMILDYRHGIFKCETTFSIPKGKLKIKVERFAGMVDKHSILMKYSIITEGDGNLNIYTGIDGEVWDINGSHYDKITCLVEDGTLIEEALTHENKDKVYTCEKIKYDFKAYEEKIEKGNKLLRKISIDAENNSSYTIYKFISIYTSKDCGDALKKAKMLTSDLYYRGYDDLLKVHKNEWEKLWKISEVIIDGDDKAMEALNYSIYHLHCIAPRHSDSLSIAARGLSGQTYKGAVFWDTEMFMLDFFLNTEPKVAKTLLKYRIDTLDGAKRKAESYGYKGAFYAWESQEGGYDACSDYNVTDVFTGRPMRTFFKDKQIHISSAIVHGIMKYIDQTGDYDLLAEGGDKAIIECAKFYYDLLLTKLESEVYELRDVIGPDEYHERVNNNAYTNRMAKFTFESAIKIIEIAKSKEWNIIKEYNLDELKVRFADAANKIYIPKPNNKTSIISQFDGYDGLEDIEIDKLKERLIDDKEYWGGAYGIASHTKVIKQADVITMLNLFHEEYSKEVLLKNWQYYEPRTEHGSSLSACMYALVACKCGLADKAYEFFLKSALTDIEGKGKQWAGLIYIGGTHPASSGGAYMTVVEGFGGIYFEDGIVKSKPCMPANWKRLSFKILYLNKLYQIDITNNEAEIKLI